MKAQRLAAIDIGTNSIRCIIVEPDQDGGFRMLDDEKSTVRLGENLTVSGCISEPASLRALESMERFRKLIDGMKVCAVEAIATSAMRRAKNGEALLAALTEKLGHPIRIITGIEEAELAMVSAQRHFDMEYKRHAVFDIGGGSVEIATALGNHVEEYYSFDLGAVLMSEAFITDDPVSPSNLKKLQKHVITTLKNELRLSMPLQTLIGSGGTVTALGAMAMNARGTTYPSVHGYEVLRSEVVHTLSMLSRKTLKERSVLTGLNPDRADIIIAGVAVVEALMEFCGANQLLVNERGIREGLIIRALEKNGLVSCATKSKTWKESALDFARSCKCDEPHSRQVSRLALTLFDSVATLFNIQKSDRKILEAAALLHDAGYFIAYASHHKHSYHLIRHAELFGFAPHEREIIAQIARYHRKTLPKKKHDSYSSLPVDDQRRVMQLGGILRLADGLDRRRNSAVEKLTCSILKNQFQMHLQGSEDLSVERYGATTKKDLFEKAFGMDVVLS